VPAAQRPSHFCEERKVATIDPTKIQRASEIPPAGNQFVGSSPSGLVDVYCGTLDGDVDAQPSAQELLATESDTGTKANADFIYNQLSAVYGGVQLPDFQSPSGNTVKCVVFVSGSSQGGYGAFHIPGTQADFDRIVVDGLNASGNYSSNSGLGAALAPEAVICPTCSPRIAVIPTYGPLISYYEPTRPPRAASSSRLPCLLRRPSKASRP
jgi:hypothetical protein